MIMYLAGLQGISNEIHEAATIDGASIFQRVTKIMWPMCRGTSLTLNTCLTAQESSVPYKNSH